MLKRLWNYMQESRKADWNGRRSLAIVVSDADRLDESEDDGKNGWKKEAIEYVKTEQCWRIVLDRMIDG